MTDKQQSNIMNDCDSAQNDTQLYKRRWLFLSTLTLLQIICGTSFSAFGQISNFFVAYFQVTYAQVDWLTIAFDVTPIFSTLPLAWLLFKRVIGFKMLAVVGAISGAVGFACFAISMADPSLFAVSVIGQTVNGLAAQLIATIPPVYAALWFPENEVGTAIGVNAMGLFIGNIIGLMVPSHLIKLRINNLTSEEHHYWMQRNKWTMIWIYCVCIAISVAVGAVLAIFATDLPPKPPTVAQKLKRNLTPSNLNMSEFLTQTKTILTNRTFIFGVLVFGVAFQSTTVEFTMMSQIIRQFSDARGLSLNYDVIGVYVMCFYSAGNVVGTLVGGKLVDKYKRYDRLSIASSVASFLSTVIVTLGVVFAQYILLYVGNFLIGVFGQVTMVVVYDLSTQQTYPIEETVVSAWLIGVMIPSGIFYGEIGRVIFNSLGGLAVVIFQSAMFLLGLLLTCLFSPVYGRLDVLEDTNRGESVETSETTKLINGTRSFE